MNSILREIIRTKTETIAAKKNTASLNRLKAEALNISPRRGFKKALERKGQINIIAEIKKATPSLGVISENFDPAKLAKEYTSGGAAAISVLTEEKYFLGELSHLEKAREHTGLPILRKDFIVDEFQVYEGAVAGADAVLLITAILELPRLKELIEVAKGLGLDSLVEVHSEADLEKALTAGSDIIGINNRDLNNFKIELETTKKLFGRVPKDKIVVAESGIKTPDDIKLLSEIGMNNFLIGNALMTSKNIIHTLKTLRSVK